MSSDMVASATPVAPTLPDGWPVSPGPSVILRPTLGLWSPRPEGCALPTYEAEAVAPEPAGACLLSAREVSDTLIRLRLEIEDALGVSILTQVSRLPHKAPKVS